jgi:L-iditol 2-dehydrogenase
MRLAELRGPREFVIVDAPVPEPAVDEVLVEVAACGVCSSELSHWRPSDPSWTVSPSATG